jgi:Uma2 family endonuclease
MPQQNEQYTYADYCTWDDGERWELIEGVPYAMSPAPLRKHQRISVELLGQLHTFLKGKPCQVFHAPFDVRLNANEEDDTVVQPDIVVVCDASKLDERGCKGTPDLVIEILSPSTARIDKLLKFNVYERAGVREYWMVDPETETVQVFVFETGTIKVYADTDTAPVHVLPGCNIYFPDVFEE